MLFEIIFARSPITKRLCCVGATPEQLLSEGYQRGKDFPAFFIQNKRRICTRTERKSGIGYHGFQFFTDTTVNCQKKDLICRDLTINAMAMDDAGQVYDPMAVNKILIRKYSAMFQMPLQKTLYVLRCRSLRCTLCQLWISNCRRNITINEKHWLIQVN